MFDVPKRDLRAQPIRVLLIEDNSVDAKFVQWLLARCNTARFEITWVKRLSDALPIVQSTQCDVVLLDLALQDSRRLSSLLEFALAAPSTPIVVLTDRADQPAVLQVIGHGAQDCFVKGKDDLSGLSRSLRFAIERKAFDVYSTKITDSHRQSD